MPALDVPVDDRPAARPPRSPAHPRPGRRRAWLVTTAATVVSAYALDAFATAAGVALVASGLLGAIEPPLPLLFLLATYIAWWIGLRANLAANWALLALTGTSTNLLSTAAHDLARARRAGARARRTAASAGYLATELAKEAPYYAGAGGAALLTESIAASEAMLFLGGANLGAAAYEYGLARATHRFLRGR
jgi:hypothetical protein